MDLILPFLVAQAPGVVANPQTGPPTLPRVAPACRRSSAASAACCLTCWFAAANSRAAAAASSLSVSTKACSSAICAS